MVRQNWYPSNLSVVDPLTVIHLPVILDYNEGDMNRIEQLAQTISAETGATVMVSHNLERLAQGYRRQLFIARAVGKLSWREGCLILEWKLADGSDFLEWYRSRPLSLGDFPDEATIGGAVHKTLDGISAHCLLNRNNAFVQWLLRVNNTCARGDFGLHTTQFLKIMNLLDSPLAFWGIGLRI